MAREVRAGLLLDLNDQLSPKIQNAGIAVEEFGEKTTDEAGKVDKTFTPKVKGAGESARGLGEKAKGAAEKVKESFSSKLSGAGISLQGFADKAVGAANKINQAFSGIAGTLGTLGVSIGALSAVNATINLDNRMARIGLTASASAAQVNELKRQIYDAALKYKISADDLTAAGEVISTNTGDLKFLAANIDNIAMAMQAAGLSGADMGGVISQFNLIGKSADDVLFLMDKFARYGDTGSYTFQEFGATAEKVMSAYGGHIGTANDDLLDMYKSMLILKAGIGSADVSASALEATLNELSSKQDDLRNLGIEVTETDAETGEKRLRRLTAIMADITALSEKQGNAFWLNGILGEQSQRAVRAFSMYAEDFDEKINSLGDTTGALGEKAATMANTLKANLQNLQTAFLSFADNGLAGPLKTLTDFLNRLAEDPEKVEDAIRNITITLGALAAVRVGAGILSFVSGLKDVFGGGKSPNLSGLSNAGGSAGMPVYVTNWGGSGGGLPGLPGSPGGGGAPGLPGQAAAPGGGGTPASGQGTPPPPAPPAPPASRGQQVLAAGRDALRSPKTIATGVGAGLAAALYEIPEMLDELHDIERDETLTGREKGAAKGGAVGKASGSIAGAAGGAIAGGVLAAMATSAIAGTAIGTAIPGLGNIAGLIIGAGIGAAGYYFGGKAGRAIGTGIGGAVAGNTGDLDAAQKNYEEALNDAADTVGKTAEEMEQARLKLVEAEARLESARAAAAAAPPPRVLYDGSDRLNPALAQLAASRQAAAGQGPGIDRNPVYRSGNPMHMDSVQGPGIDRNPGFRRNNPMRVDDLIVTPQGQFSTHPDDYIFAMKNPAALVNAGINTVNNQYQTFQGAPGIARNTTSTANTSTTNIANTRTVNDLIVTPQGQFSTHPEDYIIAMKNPAALVNPETLFPPEMRNEVRTVERVPPAIPPVTVNGEIELKSELFIDDRGYRLRQKVGKNTTPYKFAVGSAQNARLIQ